MRDFSGRTIEGSQCWVSPRYEIANRYQLTTTGDFAPKLVQLNPTTNATARTTLNSAVNPNSYANRDYRMKSTIMWDYEMSIGLTSLKSTGRLSPSSARSKRSWIKLSMRSISEFTREKARAWSANSENCPLLSISL